VVKECLTSLKTKN